MVIDQPSTGLPLALAARHAVTAPGDELRLELTTPGVERDRLDDLVAGAGFELAGPAQTRSGGGWTLTLRRQRTLADTVGPGMGVLVCGLNPSLHAADAGVGYAGPGNRFWPAALEAGLVSQVRDPLAALTVDRVGMTDLVKRATPRAADLTTAEHRHGMARVRRLVEWMQPTVICFVGLDGWRRAVDRSARPGLQPDRLAGTLVHLMPSTSGLNAATRFETLVDHFASVGHLARTRT